MRHFTDKDPLRLWPGFQMVAGYRLFLQALFRFEVTHTSGAQRLPSLNLTRDSSRLLMK